MPPNTTPRARAAAQSYRRRWVRPVRLSGLQRMHISLKKVMPFVLLSKHQPGKTLDAASLPAQLMQLARPAPLQRALF